MLNRSHAGLVCLGVCLLLLSAGLLPVYAFDDGINTAAPYMTFDPNTGTFHKINPCKSPHPPPACSGAAEAGGGYPTPETTGVQPATTQQPVAGQSPQTAAAQPAATQQPAAGGSTAAADSPRLIMIGGVVIGLTLLGAVFWSLRRKKTVANTA